MQDYDDLRERVEKTARRMIEAQTERTARNESLVQILGSLEQKYTAQHQELLFYKARIGPLEQANAQLSNLMAKLLDMVDTGLGEESLDPVRRASAMAAAMLETDLIVPPDESGGRDTDETGTAFDQPGYEDVDPERLAKELAEDADDPETLPEPVRRAAAAATVIGREDADGRDAGSDDDFEIVSFTDADASPDGEVVFTRPRKSGLVDNSEVGAGPSAPDADTVRTVDALADALGRKSDAGEPLAEADIKALLGRVEALARQKAEIEDGFDIPPDGEEEDLHLFARNAASEKTGTAG